MQASDRNVGGWVTRVLGNQQAHDFVDEEWVALGGLMNRSRQGGGRGHRAGGLHHVRNVVRRQAAEWDTVAPPGDVADDTCGFREPLHLHLAVRANDEQAGVMELAGEELQQEERRLIGGVQVVEEQHQRLRTGDALEQLRGGIEEGKAGVL